MRRLSGGKSGTRIADMHAAAVSKGLPPMKFGT
jgi:hypothetical protein